LERLTSAKPSADGFVTCGSSRVMACSLSSATVERACRVLDAIERALPAAGARLAHNQEAKRVEVDVGGERLGISLAEDYTRTETVEVDPKYSWMKSRTFTYHPKNRSYPGAESVGGGVGRPIWPTMRWQM
jgi:hypothetical protein